jgi:catechol 2,3-dioxygenase-like lactoylglutathione lyase family enzyme
MLSASKVTAFVATADAQRARAFYEGVLGLRLLSDDHVALVFDANGTPLRVAKVQQLSPAPYTVLGWTVADISATVRGLAAKGVAFERYEGMAQDELAIWSPPGGGKVAWFKDPDGNLLSVTEWRGGVETSEAV